MQLHKDNIYFGSLKIIFVSGHFVAWATSLRGRAAPDYFGTLVRHTIIQHL